MNETPTQNPEKKFNFKTGAVFLVTFAGAFFLTTFLMKPSFDKELVNVANEINKSCPMRVDQYMTLQNVMALPDKTIQYNYSLVDLTKAEVNLDTVKKYVFSGVLTNIKNNPDMQLLRDNDATFNYVYKDKNGDFVCKYVVTPGMYEAE